MKSTDIIEPTVLTAPLAYKGTKNDIPVTATGTNEASVEEGFPEITSVPKTDGGLPPVRQDFNGMFYLSTDQKVYLQNGGIITFSDDVSDAIGGYPTGAILDYIDSDGYYCKVKSLIDDNTYNFVEDSSYIDDTYWSYVDYYNSSDIYADTDLSNLTDDGEAHFANLDLSNLSDTGESKFISVTETYDSTSALSGYILYSNGFCIQWGKITTTSANTWTTVTLLVSYKNAYYSVFGVNSGSTSNIYTVKVSQVSTQTKSTFQLMGSNSSTGINWLTIGFAS